MLGRLSLRERLVVLVVVAILPLLALPVWFAVRQAQSASALAQSQLKFAASLVAANQDRTVEAAEHLLGAISGMPEMRSPQRKVCEEFFESLQGRYPIYANIGVFDTQGAVVCHANGRIGDFSAADRPYFAKALSERRFVMGAPATGKASGRFIIPFARPVFDGDNVTGVVFASLDLEHAAAVLAATELPAGAHVVVADRRGVVLMEHPPRTDVAPGASVVDADVLAAARRMEPGSGETSDAVGEPRLYAFAPSRMVGGEGFMAVVSIDSRQLARASFTALRTELAVLAATLLMGLVAAWWVGGRVIVKPAKQILGTVRRLEQGRLDARVPLAGGTSQRGELARIGAAFNLMADSLQVRQHDLEAELGRSRSAYEVLDLVLNSMQEALVAVTSAGRFLMFNEAAARLFPLRADGAPPLPRQWPELFGFYRADGVTLYEADDLPLVRSARGESGRQPLLIVRNAQVPEGRLLQCSWQPIHGEGGMDAGLVVFTDVTELERLQAEQAAQLAQLQRAAEAAQLIMAHPSVEATLQEVADQARSVIGARHARVTLARSGRAGSPAYSLSGEADAAPLTGKELAVPLVSRSGRHIGRLQISGKAPGGFTERDEYVLLELAQLASIAIENARLFTEIRELNAGLEARIAERTAELMRQEQLYRTLAEQAPEVVWNTDAQGRATFLNRAWYDLVGGAPGEWLGNGWLRRVHPDDRGEVQRNWLLSRDTLQPYSGIRRVLARDGTYHTMSYKAAPVLGEQGQVAFWVGIDADITEFKAIERALRSSNQDLEAFSYSVSHDLRAPLGAIGGFSQALALELDDRTNAGRVRHYLARIQAGVEKMEQLIDALLSLAKVARAPLNYGPVDLSASAREMLEGLQMQHPGRGVEAQVQEGLVAQGDARLLRVVLENLLGNAWKFTSQRKDARIEVGRVAGGNVFFVRDNGVGFDMAYASRLFGAFQRLHTEAEFPGTGIGLATVRRIIARHQGRVWAESVLGAGTTFFFALSQTAPPAWLAVQDAA